MIQRQYENFCCWRVRHAISINGLTIDQAMDVNNLSVDDYCNFYHNTEFSFMNSSNYFGLDVVTKPTSLLVIDIQIAFRDYITFETNYDYYKSWKDTNQNAQNCLLDFVNNNIYTSHIEKKKQIFETKIQSVLNYFDPTGFEKLDWLIDFLTDFSEEIKVELTRLEQNIRIVNSSLLKDHLEKWILRNNLSVIEQEAVIEYYVKMSSFDICKKSLFYLDSLIKYVLRFNRPRPWLQNVQELNFSFDLIFKNKYKSHAESFYEAFINRDYPVSDNKYWYRLYYDEMVKVGLAKSKSTGLPLITAARCFKSKFPEINLPTFQDNRPENNFGEAREIIRSDIKVILNEMQNFPINELDI